MTESKAMAKFQAERISRSAEFTVHGDIEDVFPLFGPVREKEWAGGWDPEMVYSTDKIVDEHMVFLTNGHHPSEPKYLWALTQFRPEIHQVEYTVSTPNRIWFIRVKCAAAGPQTRVKVTYTFTSVNALGTELNRAALNRMYAHDLSDWGEAINHYLATGEKLIQ